MSTQKYNWRVVVVTKEELFEDTLIAKTMLGDLKWKIITFTIRREKQIIGPVFELETESDKAILVYRYQYLDYTNEQTEWDIAVEVAKKSVLSDEIFCGCIIQFARKAELIKVVEEQVFDLDGIMSSIIESGDR